MSAPPRLPASVQSPKKKMGCLRALVISFCLFVGLLIYAANEGRKIREEKKAAELQRAEQEAAELARRFPEEKARVLLELANATDAGDEKAVEQLSNKYRNVSDQEYRDALIQAHARLAVAREEKQAALAAEQKRRSDEAAKVKAEADAQARVAAQAAAAAELASLPRIPAASLHKEYDQNEVSADAKWKGKLAVISGKIHSIEKDFLGNAYVTLGWDEYGFQSVRCDFGKDMEPLKALQKGDLVKIKGRVDGFLMHNVMVKQCSLTQ